jgi:hypothetical protein
VSQSSNPGSPAAFVKVFDVLDSGFKSWTFSAFGLIFVAAGVLLFVGPRLIKATSIPFFDLQARWSKNFRYLFLGFAVLWTVVVFASTYEQHLRHRELARSNACRVVEGPVDHFLPMPYAGHANESFSVQGVHFEYSDYVVTDAFNNTSSHGGPIAAGSYARICYDPSGNQILRLEIRDFQGDAKDYSKANPIFERPDPRQAFGRDNPVRKLPWYGSLFVWLGILDFLGISTLYLPYLDTFFRIKRESSAWTISQHLDRQKKVELRQCLLFWDDTNKSIWIRPRGLNLLQVQFVVAKLTTDDFGRSVVNQEIRLSSGAPFVLAALLATAYRMVSGVIPASSNGPSPGWFVGIAAVLFIVSGFVNLRMFASRMERLIRDARPELEQR